MAESSTSDIVVVIPLYNKAAVLEDCLGSVLNAVASDALVRVTVFDNGSTDGSREIAERMLVGRGVPGTTRQRTIAAVRNHGARESTEPIIAFIDADCRIPPDYFTAMRRLFEDSAIAGAGRWVDLPEDHSWIERVWHRLHCSTGDGFRTFINSGNFAVRRAAFDAVGGFDETLVTGEDAELCQRLVDRGFRLYESQALAVLHLDNPRTVSQFFRKERWHARGMFGTVRRSSLDRPTAMMFAHLLAIAGAVALLIVPDTNLVVRLAGCVALAIVVPAATVLYRMSAGRRVAFLPAVVLYELYYLARLVALGALLFSRSGRAR